GGAQEEEQEREEGKQRYGTRSAHATTEKPAHSHLLAPHNRTALRFEIVLREIPQYCWARHAMRGAGRGTCLTPTHPQELTRKPKSQQQKLVFSLAGCVQQRLIWIK